MLIIKKVFLTIIILLCILSLRINVVRAQENLDQFELVTENRQLRLYIHPGTTEIAVYDKQKQKTWYSNPPEREQKEKIAQGRTRERLSSQLRITFYTPGDRKKYMNNFTDSVQEDQFEIERIDQGVRIEYKLGAEWQDSQYVPEIISKDRMEENILAEIEDEGDREFVKDLYYPLELVEKPEEYERYDLYGVDVQEVFGDFVFKNEQDKSDKEIQKYYNNFFSRIVENREEFNDFSDVKQQDIIHFSQQESYILKNDLAKWDINDFIEILKEIGYGPEDVSEDYLENNFTPPQRNVRIFEIPLEYRLLDEGLTVKIPADEIYYPQEVIDPDRDGQRSTMPLVRISVLENFGMADNQDEGYMFVPDGSGAIINLNNGKTDSPAYSQDIYGPDMSNRPREEMKKHQNLLHFPVFGLTTQNQGWLAVVEKGAPVGRIEADIAGRTNSFNGVNASFNTIPQAQVSLSGHLEDYEQRYMNVYQSRLMKGDIQLKYFFLDEDEADYVGLAHTYQDYLLQKGYLEQLEPVEEIPFMLEVLGSIHRQEPVMGVPRRVVKPVSDYEQTKMIVEELQENEIDNIDLRYTGWFSGGTEHNFPGDFHLESVVGEKQELLELYEYLKEKDISFYPEIGFQYIYNDQMFDGFKVRQDSSRFINRKAAYVNEYNLANYQEEPDEEQKFILSPGRLNYVRDNFLAGYTPLEINNLALKHIGQHLNSNFRRQPEQLIDRPQAQQKVVSHLQELKDSNLDLMLRGANDYTLPFSNKLTDMPLDITAHNIIDEGIPFMQIVLHGFYNYAGEPLNLADTDREFLKVIETGVLPYYKWIYEPSVSLKQTPFDENYNLFYGDWLKKAQNNYEQINEIYKDLHHQPIVEHRKVENGVYVTGFEDGTRIVTNYNQYAVEYEGRKVETEGYVVLPGGEGE